MREHHQTKNPVRLTTREVRLRRRNLEKRLKHKSIAKKAKIGPKKASSTIKRNPAKGRRQLETMGLPKVDDLESTRTRGLSSSERSFYESQFQHLKRTEASPSSGQEPPLSPMKGGSMPMIFEPEWKERALSSTTSSLTGFCGKYENPASPYWDSMEALPYPAGLSNKLGNYQQSGAAIINTPRSSSGTPKASELDSAKASKLVKKVQTAQKGCFKPSGKSKTNTNELWLQSTDEASTCAPTAPQSSKKPMRRITKKIKKRTKVAKKGNNNRKFLRVFPGVKSVLKRRRKAALNPHATASGTIISIRKRNDFSENSNSEFLKFEHLGSGFSTQNLHRNESEISQNSTLNRDHPTPQAPEEFRIKRPIFQRPKKDNRFDIGNMVFLPLEGGNRKSAIDTSSWQNRANIIVPFIRVTERSELEVRADDDESSDEELIDDSLYLERHERCAIAMTQHFYPNADLGSKGTEEEEVQPLNEVYRVTVVDGLKIQISIVPLDQTRRGSVV